MLPGTRGLCERQEPVHLVPLPWLWYFVFRDCCPNRIWSFLLFKPSFEYFFNVIHAKCTDCRTRNAGKGENHQENHQGTTGPPRPHWQAQNVFSPVELSGKHPNHSGDAIDLYYVCDRLQNIKVEKRISGDRTVKPSLQKRSPVFLQDTLGATHVIFTYAGHTGIHSLPKGQEQSDVAVSVGEDGNGRLLLTAGARHAKDISGSQESSSLLSRDLDS